MQWTRKITPASAIATAVAGLRCRGQGPRPDARPAEPASMPTRLPADGIGKQGPAADDRGSLDDEASLPCRSPRPRSSVPKSSLSISTRRCELAGVQNPELNSGPATRARSRRHRQLAAARFLPSINPGMNYDTHTGNLQQSNGNILSVNRSAVYVGAAACVAAGTVHFPGVFLGGNIGRGIFNYLASRAVRSPAGV